MKKNLGYNIRQAQCQSDKVLSRLVYFLPFFLNVVNVIYLCDPEYEIHHGC